MIPAPPSGTRLRAHVCTERCGIETPDGPRCVDDLVAAYPDGLSDASIAELLGLTRQGVDVIIRVATDKFAAAVARKQAAAKWKRRTHRRTS